MERTTGHQDTVLTQLIPPLTVFVRVSLDVIKCHDKMQFGEERAYFILQFIMKGKMSEQELKQKPGDRI